MTADFAPPLVGRSPRDRRQSSREGRNSFLLGGSSPYVLRAFDAYFSMMYAATISPFFFISFSPQKHLFAMSVAVFIAARRSDGVLEIGMRTLA